MTFQPFGFAFDMRSPLDLDESKRRIRECKTHWYDPNEGPRGFIAGRFICLWNGLLQRHGPMLIGWLSEDPTGCRVTGRSGSDINGMLYLSLIASLLMIAGIGLFRQGEMSPPAALTLGLCAICIFLLLWSASRDRRAGVGLVGFVELAVGSRAQHEFR